MAVKVLSQQNRGSRDPVLPPPPPPPPLVCKVNSAHCMLCNLSCWCMTKVIIDVWPPTTSVKKQYRSSGIGAMQ